MIEPGLEPKPKPKPRPESAKVDEKRKAAGMLAILASGNVPPERALTVIAAEKTIKDEGIKRPGKQPLTMETFEGFVLEASDIERNYFKFPDSFQIEDMRSVISEFLDEQRKMIESGTKKEIGTHVVLDAKSFEYRQGTIQHGTELTVGNHPSREVTGNGYSVIGIHTHPTSDGSVSPLPSSADYVRLLMGSKDEDGHVSRVAPASMVVCDDMQILMLPSDQTPVFPDFDDAVSCVNEYDAELKDRLDNVKGFREDKSKLVRFEQSVLNDTSRIRVRGNMGLLSKAEGESDETFRVRFEQYRDGVNRRYARFLELRGEILKRNSGVWFKEVTNSQLEIAQALSVHLYMATDFQNWQMII